VKAIVCARYGSPDVLQLREVARPAPKDDEVLIRAHAASINSRDWRLMRANPFFIRLVPGGFLQPKNGILGADVAGRVEVIGSNVKQFKPGDEVFGYLPSATGRGTFAEYVCANEKAITLKPANLTFEQAAAVPEAAMTALQGLRNKGNLHPGQKVLINGASGGVGTFAVQIAKAFGAEVTGVCSTRNLEMVRSIGADHVIDYTKEDFQKRVVEITEGKKLPVVYDSVGKDTFMKSLDCLAPLGLMVSFGQSSGLVEPFSINILTGKGSLYVTRPTLIHYASTTEKLRAMAKELFDLVAGGIVKIEIGQTYPLKEVAQAHRDLEARKTTGSTVLTV
jgi:NADPH:quinone reductase-like Zn-dependent oxidoreductase